MFTLLKFSKGSLLQKHAAQLRISCLYMSMSFTTSLQDILFLYDRGAGICSGFTSLCPLKVSGRDSPIVPMKRRVEVRL